MHIVWTKAFGDIYVKNKAEISQMLALCLDCPCYVKCNPFLKGGVRSKGNEWLLRPNCGSAGRPGGEGLRPLQQVTRRSCFWSEWEKNCRKQAGRRLPVFKGKYQPAVCRRHRTGRCGPQHPRMWRGTPSDLLAWFYAHMDCCLVLYNNVQRSHVQNTLAKTR